MTTEQQQIADYIRSLHCDRWKTGEECYKSNCRTFHWIAGLIEQGAYRDE